MSGPSKASASDSDALRLQAGDSSFENDFADLAARFAAKSGGGLSPELSADLALEVVLNEMVEQACLATGATGAAIVLEREGEWVCRASSGLSAPELGARLDAGDSLSGECLRTRRTQRCDDVLADQRADLEASARLGVRSLIVMPLLKDEQLLGIFELFSSRPTAFGERDERTLEVLANRALSNLQLAIQQVQPPIEAAPTPDPAFDAVDKIPRETPDDPSVRRNDVLTWILSAAVLACAILLGLVIGRHVGIGQARAHWHVARASTARGTAVAPTVPADSPNANSVTDSQPAASPAPARPIAPAAIPPGGLRIYDSGKEVFRMPPIQKAVEGATGAQPTSLKPATEQGKVVELSPTAAQDGLVQRVEPRYPEEARRQKIQGAVVLDLHIGADGTVQEVQVLSGPPQLAQASTDAVKQWRFKPHAVNGHPVEMETRVTLNFRLAS
jgi:TonB family protein